MFEETNLIQNELDTSARKRACFRHCRLRKMRDGDISHQGICTCDCPAECRFPFPQRDAKNSNVYFTDVAQFYRQLATE